MKMRDRSLIMFIVVQVVIVSVLAYLYFRSSIDLTLEREFSNSNETKSLNSTQIPSPSSVVPETEVAVEINQTKTFLMLVICKYDGFYQRMLQRDAYIHILRKYNNVDLKFSIGKPPDDLKATIQTENEYHKDLIVLEQEENMNNGKTYFSLQAVSQLWPSTYQFIVKMDTDSFLYVEKFLQFLPTINKTSSYGGALQTMFWEKEIKPQPTWVPGGFYFLSIDLVHSIVNSPYSIQHKSGPEDVSLAYMAHNVSCQHYYHFWGYKHGMKDPKSWWEGIGKAKAEGQIK